MIDGYDVEVKLLAMTGLVEPLGTSSSKYEMPPHEQLIEYAGRLCWDTTEQLATNPQRIQEWIKVGHESVIEHASATFYVRASRVFTHELVRHRLASYSQRSQRYVKETEPRYILPPEVHSLNGHPKADGSLEVFQEAMSAAWAAYQGLLSRGVKPEIARYVLPNACVKRHGIPPGQCQLIPPG